MTPEEAARIVQQAHGTASLDAMVEMVEALAIHVDGLDPDDARARAERYRAAVRGDG